MVSAHVAGSSGPLSSSPGQGHCSVLLGKTVKLIKKYLLSLHATETGISSGLMCHLARRCTQTVFLVVSL